MECSAGSTPALARDLGNPHDSRSFEQLPSVLCIVDPTEMTDAKDVRPEVEAVIALHLSIDYFPIRCISTQNPIHESRLELVEMYEEQAEELRLTLKPAVPVILGTDGLQKNQPLAYAAPRAAYAQVVRGKQTRRASVPTDSPLRIWKSDILRILHRIGEECEASLTDGVECWMALKAMNRTERQLNQTLGSPSSRKRLGQKKRAEMQTRLELIRAVASIYREQRVAITRSRLNRDAIVRFDHEASRFGSATRAYIYREQP